MSLHTIPQLSSMPSLSVMRSSSTLATSRPIPSFLLHPTCTARERERESRTKRKVIMALERASSPMDEKAKRTRDLLTSFYSTDSSSAAAGGVSGSTERPAPSDSVNSVNSINFDADVFMSIIIQRLSLDGLLQKHVEMAAEIKNLDTDLQMLVYENYNKFICVTDTIKRMKSNILGMEANMEQLLDKIMSVQSKRDVVNTSLFEKREHREASSNL